MIIVSTAVMLASPLWICKLSLPWGGKYIYIYILLIISNNKQQLFWWMVYQLWNPSRQKCEGEGGLGNFGLDLLIVLLCMYCHSVPVCHPPLLSPCVSFASAHTLLSSSTYFPSGCGCQHTAQNSAWETQSKTGTDSPRCTDHSGGS